VDLGTCLASRDRERGPCRERRELMAEAGITGLLQEWRGGDQSALDDLVPLVHDELRRLARRQMRRERRDHTLQTSALINEAYLRLAGVRRMHWRDRTHFFAMASRLMRRVLVDHARGRRYLKRGGDGRKVALDEIVDVAAEPQRDLVALDAALSALEALDARKSRVVELRFFGGLTVEETADVLRVHPDTVTRDWRFAKAWLLRQLRGSATA
jgi:RNA polymerase sigma-70 factor, ECF subfamily